MSQNYDPPASSDSISNALGTKTPNCFDALLTCHSGGTAPTTTAAYMLWADTSTGYLKMRDSGDANWIALYPLALPAGISCSRIDYGALSATGTINRLFMAPTACVIRAVGLVGDTATTSSSGNEWTFSLDDVISGGGQALFSGTVGTFTSLAGVGGGSELGVDGGFLLTPDQNATLDALDVLDFTMTKSGTATTVADLQVFLYWQMVA